MSPHASELAGRVLMIGLPGPALDDAGAVRVRRLAPGGVILFRRNLTTPEQLKALLGQLRGLLSYPLLVAIDQEGGRVSRLEPWIGPTPDAHGLARHGRGAVERYAMLSGRLLRALDIDINFAPVVDLCGPDAGNGIDERAYADDPERTIEMAAAYLDGLQGVGVAGCLKHFPGLGCTRVDSHVTLPVVPRSAGELESLDLRPFRELCPRAASVMVGHGHYPAWDRSVRPASASATVLDRLRRELGFRGLVVSDDLEMGAVAQLDVGGSFAVESLEAGCDLLLYCSDLDRAEAARETLVVTAERRLEFRTRLGSAAVAVAHMARRWTCPTVEPCAWPAAREELATFSRCILD